ncbi:hypothetical protein [Pseudomonas sp. BMS12]|uniref:hypothetical protein n=1 Tax=Pseudomonas sp. BMS12 TaxID=1796033 RepID=UPI00083A1904|nr:hypothetical protein [Pseudomonas sp. BMS12]
MDSYSVRCIFRWEPRQRQKAKHTYEERITLWQAESLDQAIELAEQEAEIYASDDMEFLGYSQAYALFEPLPGNGVEIFSLLRDSNLEPEEYIDAFFDTELEHQREYGSNKKKGA